MFYPSVVGTSGRASSAAQQAQSDAREARNEVEYIKHDIERLLMITEALWMILKRQHGYQDNELTKLIAEIDLRDGRLDGRVAKDEPRHCPYCDRPMSPRRSLCIFCGKVVEGQPFAR